MKASEVRAKYIEFFKDKGHSVIPSAPIVPVDDSTTLFTGSGMQQLVPYLKGAKHPLGTRLVDSQPCFRAEDIDEIGDNRHTTFYEMLGNWSLGDYFKQDQLKWIWEFLTKELKLDKNRLHITLFEGSKEVPKDDESYQILHNLGVHDKNIHWYDATKNWWSRAGTPSEMPAGEIGGPTSEIFYEYKDVVHDSRYGNNCHVNCDCGRYIELGNSVFMEYEKTAKGLKKLPAQNVDFGGGLERLTAAAQNTPDVFVTDLFTPIIKRIETSSAKNYLDDNQQSMRIIADHLRGATIMIAQGTEPSNKQQGYFVRRLIRRALVKMRSLETKNPEEVLTESARAVMQMFDGMYLDQKHDEDRVLESIQDEVKKFTKTLDRGLKEIAKKDLKDIDAKFSFHLYQSYGFPFEITQEILQERGSSVSQEEFDEVFAKHKDQSRTASAGMFKGGLADHSEAVTKLHTTTHLLHQAMRTVLGDEVTQAGSNITSERLRFDYTISRKPGNDELDQIEKIINDKINDDLPVTKSIEDKDKALSSGALAFFSEKYADQVSVYTIGKDTTKDWFSKELCGGPHVSSTGVIGGVTIKKDESLGAGKRRIYAVLK